MVPAALVTLGLLDLTHVSSFRRLLVIIYNGILATWSVDWQTNLEEIDGAPRGLGAGREVKVFKAQRKAFGSKSNTKIIECTPAAAKVRTLFS